MASILSLRDVGAGVSFGAARGNNAKTLKALNPKL